MRRSTLVILVVSIALSHAVLAQDFNTCVKNRELHFIAQDALHNGSLTPATPLDESLPDDRVLIDDELAQLHAIQKTRTDREVEKANKDAMELDMFIFQPVFSDQFNAANPALIETKKLSQDICGEVTAVSEYFKKTFKRRRPFLIDKTLHPATDTSFLQNSPSYPSGHTMTGYLEALALAEMFPQKRTEILERAQEFAHNRMVLGVHFGSDVASGREIAYGMFALMKKNPAFRAELDKAQKEIQAKIQIEP